MIFLQNFLIDEKLLIKIINKWKIICLYKNDKLKITHS